MKIPFLSGLKVNGKVELNNLSLLSTPTKILTIDENNNITYSTSVGGSVDLSNYYNKSQTDTNISNAIANLVSSAPTTLDTLNELAAALGNDPNFATTVTNLIGTKPNSSDVYLRSASDARYKAITWLPTWNDVQSRPTALSQFTNDLGLSSIYQPLENQRLSTSNNVVFNQITANSKLNIPSTSSNKYSLYVDENGIGGTGSTIPIISYLNDLADVSINTPDNGNVLMYNGSGWINSTVTSGTFNYNDLYNKPTLLSQFTNDLGLDSVYHPLENQRLSSNVAPHFTGLRLNNSDNNYYNDILFQHNGLNRWNLYTEGVEGGGDSGSNIYFASYTDSSEYKANIFSVNRASNILNFSNRPTIAGVGVVSDDGNTYNITANNALLWNGFAYGGSSGVDIGQFVGYDNAGNIKFYSINGIKASLNVGDGSTLNNNITGSAGSVNWSNVISRPTNLSQFTNDLGLGSIFQPMENQRLSTSNNVVFNQITANSKLNIPSTSTNKYSIFIDENGLGGGSQPIPIVAALNDLNDVTISSPVNGNVLTYNGSQWINGTVTSGTFNYNELFNKPTNLSQFINDLGNYGSWITAASLPDLTFYHKSIGFVGGYPSADANTVAENTSSFSYANNAPYNGALVYFGNGGYGLQLNSSYSSLGGRLAFRTRNSDGDFNDFNPWKELVHDGYSRSWDLNINGTANNATLWRGFAYGGSSTTNGIGQFVGYDNDGNIKFYTINSAKSTLNIGDGSTLNNSITGNALSWGGTPANFGEYATTANWFVVGQGGLGMPMQISNVKSVLNISDGSTLYNNITGNASTAGASNTTNYLKAQNIYPSVINDTTSAQSLVEGSLTRVDFHENNGAFGAGYANTITTSSYDRYAATQISTSYNAITPRMAIRNFNQALDGWNNWVEVLTNGNTNLQTITNLGNTTTNSLGANTYYAPNWFRSYGATGWYNEDFGGGIYMTDSTWIRTYNTKGFYVAGGNGIISEGIVKAGTGYGFQNIGYQAGRNRIWSFSNADNYGLSFHQGSSSIYANDGIGIHFGDANNPQFNFLFDGLFYAPTVKATNSLQIPAKNTSGVATGNHFSIWVEV